MMNLDECGMATLKETDRIPVRLQDEHTVTPGSAIEVTRQNG